jgi:23S rRNA-/tRNA-specific pseudouridylate synthase
MSDAVVLHRDARWLVLAKAPGMVTTPPSSRPGPTLLDLARGLSPDAETLHPLSRLDAEVSGAVLFALRKDALAAAARTPPSKRYLALAIGAPAEDAFVWRWPVGVNPRRATLRSCAADARDAQAAETRGRVLARAGGYTALALEPVTGRTHQLRVHAATAGHPLLGDTSYGGAARITGADGAVTALPRAMLHAWWVTIPGGPRVVAPPHEDLARAWAAVGGGALDLSPG